MENKIYASFGMAALLVIAGTAVSWAKVPPPPVNQNIGIFDGVFNTMKESDCRSCHNQNPPVGIPVDPTYLPDRHHLLLGTHVPSPTAAPHPPDANGNYECLTCHTMAWNAVTWSWDLDPNFRDCLLCHQQVLGQASVHHLTPAAQVGDCAKCHGFIESYNKVGKYIPTYPASLVTPWPSGKPQSGPAGEGNCKFCHNSGLESGMQVYTNSQTHHSTGLVLDGSKCKWCHNVAITDPKDPNYTNNNLSIRACEQCHTVKSLHNIQAAADLGSITPGSEPAYFGHIGAQADCWGCHGFTAPLAAPYSGPITPAVDGVSMSSMTAGVNTAITVTGTSFINDIVNPMTGASVTVTSDIAMTDAAGVVTTLKPLSVAMDTLDVIIPGTLPAGNYTLTAVKGPSSSNSLKISIVPAVKIASLSYNLNLAKIGGSGFGTYLDANGSGTKVTLTRNVTKYVKGRRVVTKVTETCKVGSWNTKEIQATCSTKTGLLGVSSVYGTASVNISYGVIK